MIKQITICLLITVLLTTASSTEAQQTGKIFRIGFLDQSNASTSEVRLDAFWQELRNLGWVEGKNISVEYRFAEEKSARHLSWRRIWFVLRLM